MYAIRSYYEVTSTKINLQSNINKDRFGHNIEVILYRATCELINNTIKYASAKRIDIDIMKHDDFV